MIERIVVPHDLTELSDRSFPALESLGLLDATVHVVHVLPRIDLSFPGVVWSADEDEPRRRHAHELLRDRLPESLRERAVVHVSVGDAGTRIVALAAEVGASLILMPSHGRSGMSRMLLGSVAEYVARFAQCPVIILPRSVDPRFELLDEKSPRPETKRADQVHHIANLLAERASGDRYLTAARVGLSPGEDPLWWSRRLEDELSDSGIDFVDLSFSFGDWPQPVLLSCRFARK
ncbi:MAG: universal stress protein [Myxococcales bacterium]|nr:universal stress protein [Myxococcales bacterium]